MSFELTMLVWSVALAFIQMLVAVAGASLVVGLPKLVGNRDDLPTMTGWAERAQRAHANMLESLVLFAALVLVADIANRYDYMTGLGVQLFFWARLVYAIVYIAGVPWVRTAVWSVSVIGLILIFLQVV
jgi:uncharacterized MAPEG superfamily protein